MSDNALQQTQTNDSPMTSNSVQQTKTERTVTPRASVYETQEAVVLELEMPGVSRDAIEVSVENDELTVSGRRVFHTDEGYEYIHQERLPFSYRRSFILSERIDAGNIAAKYTDGILKLTLPKSAEAKPRRITIE